VLDDRNLRSLLLSNRLDGTTDQNPLRTAIVHDEPRAIPYRPKGRVVWDGRIQLLGWDAPKSVVRGARFDVTLYYKILQPVGGTWKTLVHIDGAGVRAGIGDHDSDRRPVPDLDLAARRLHHRSVHHQRRRRRVPERCLRGLDRVLHRLEPELAEHDTE